MRDGRASARRLAVAVLLSWPVALQGCGVSERPGGEADGGAAESRDRAVRIVMVTHGQSADPFWSVVAAGAMEAADELGVRVEYQAPGTFNMVEMSQMIDAAVASGPDGLAVSIPDASALASSIRTAVDAGLPVLSLNSGEADYRPLGLRTHIGQPERDAGYAAGRRLAESGVRNAVCVNHEVGNVALDDRCAGFEDALREAGGMTRVLAVDLADPQDAQERVAGAIARDPAIDGLLTLGPAGAVPALQALEASGKRDEVRLGTFDLSLPVLQAIQEGGLRFAIDQQPFLQGYLAVVLLRKLVQVGAAPDGVIRTGPAFVTAENVAEVMRLVEQGVR